MGRLSRPELVQYSTGDVVEFRRQKGLATITSIGKLGVFDEGSEFTPGTQRDKKIGIFLDSPISYFPIYFLN